MSYLPELPSYLTLAQKEAVANAMISNARSTSPVEIRIWLAMAGITDDAIVDRIMPELMQHVFSTPITIGGVNFESVQRQEIRARGI